MRFGKPLRILLVVVASFIIIGVCGIIALRIFLGHARNFKAQAQLGQPIVRAIEEYRKQTSAYPASLAELVPKYLPAVPDQPDQSTYKYSGWEYHPITKGLTPSYQLRYYMGRGGIEYDPPKWIANDEGTRTVVLSNE